MTEFLWLLFSSSFWLVKALFLIDWFIGEQHVLEDLGRIPTVADWLGRIQPESWMLGKERLSLHS
jgi:hypothetical protein